MVLACEVIGDVTVIELEFRRLDASSGAALCADLESHIEEDVQLVLDLNGLVLVDSRGVGAVLTCLKHLVAVGGDLKLCCLRPGVRAMFELTRMHRIIEIFETRTEAAASYG